MGYLGAGVTRFNTADGLTVTGDADITGAITTDGLTTTANVNFGDNDKAIFGAGSDLQIYHDVSHSYIVDNGTGNLRIKAQNFQVLGNADSEAQIEAYQNDGVYLYFDGDQKLATTSGGIDVTGTVTADGLTVDGNKIGISNAAPASVRASDTIINMQDSFVTVGATNINLSHNVFHNGTNWVRSTTDSVGHLQVANNQLNFFNSTSDTAGTTVSFTKRMNINGGGDISFYDSTGVTQGFFWDASAENLGIGTTSPSVALHVKGGNNPIISQSTSTGGGPNYLKFIDSASTDLGYVGYGAANKSLYLVNFSADPIIFYNSSEKMRIDSSGNVGIGTSSPDEKLHVFAGSAGTVTASTNADLVVENSANTGLNILTPNNQNGQILFGDPEDNDVGRLQYNHTSDYMAFYTNANERMRIDSSGNVGIGTTSPTGKLDIVGGSTYQPHLRITNNAGGGRIYGINVGVAALNNGYFSIKDETADAYRIVITDSGNVGIGTTSPATLMHLKQTSGNAILRINSDSGERRIDFGDSTDDDGGRIKYDASDNMLLFTNGSEAMRIDSSGSVGIGTSSPIAQSKLTVAGGSGSISVTGSDGNFSAGGQRSFMDFAGGKARVGGTGGGGAGTTLGLYVGTGTEAVSVTATGNVGIGTSSPLTKAHIQNSDVAFTPDTSADFLIVENNGTSAIQIVASTTDKSELFFSDTTRNRGGFSYNHNGDYLATITAGSEAMRIDSSGNLMIGKTSMNSNSVGFQFQVSGGYLASFTRSSGPILNINRTGTDGTLVNFQQDGTLEGYISVSGTTVSYNGGHLSRWSRLADDSKDTSIVKGTVMTNLDAMVEWGNEANEQLNKMAVSSVEGDANVAGVFVNWDEDDDDFNDMNVAMTGDMVIRIAQGTTVARGDLLMSAGDGTAKPQGDDIVRSKTIAKVTSTHISHTYDDGSYLVPCVLMAC